jgi:hypothetical protein
MLSKEQKVFGLGLSKTGTSSLSEALNYLGIKTIHYPSDELTWRELRSGNYRLTLMNEWQGAVDISVAPFYPQLDEAFPQSKFILTVREKETWLRSCEQHWALMHEWLDNFPETKRFQEFIGAVTYGVMDFNRHRFSWAYDQQVESVRKYFKDRPEDFLEINICGGEGWPELSRFLGYETPDIPFPRANEWMHLLLEAKHSAEELIPAGTKILLIDQAGFGSTFAPQHQTLPFLEKEGIYWGIPENDAVATTEFLRMINDGIDFVAVGFPCFWWLTHYPEFERNLRQKTESLRESNSVKILRVKKS